jgi:molecular chaperone Hsp33
MGDELVSALLKEHNLRVLVTLTSETSRKAREQGSLSPTSAVLLSQGLTAAALMGALQKEKSRINVQLECDGPLRGFFADADSEGRIRGYVKNPHVEFAGASEAFRWRPVLGNSGFLSILRDLGQGEFYRSSVELTYLDFARDLERYFEISEQLRTHVLLDTIPVEREPLGLVAGLLMQPLPDGDAEAFSQLGARLRDGGAFRTALEPATAGAGAVALLRALFPQGDLEVMSRYPVALTCSCSRARVMNALLAMGRAELTDLLEKEGQAEATCQFCSTRYVIAGDEIRAAMAEASG